MLAQLSPVAFRILGVEIYWYAIIIVSGIILAVWLSSREAVRVGMQSDDVVDFMIWGLPSAIIGARFYYVIFEWQDYLKNPIDIFLIRNGGLAVYGGLIGGGLALFFFARNRFISTWLFLDIAAPSVILAQGIGRWGNFMNHEAYGPDTTRSFLESLHLPNFLIENMNIAGIYRQPTFLYESIWSVLGFIVLILLRRKKNFLKEGEIFLLYVIWYSFGRFFIEGLRTDSLYVFDLIRVSQLLSIILFVGAIVLLAVRRRNAKLPFYNREQQLSQKSE
ncbi:prolipoprotein diacylglyceryl transferase [Enterococcus sp. BWT-B8]|uniref:prolipoprotein diacylglyceryl transferase n=1 Tax=Enterococcus sp. BWT-B8 TaxID=2885157 RepID=UPI001E345533|nr:prolipoprotein diacylglyceryl transferase [Enterococcus sp. BWT-B8]MCB5951702.1 prolipoprotein diacylglyceryl transferase [Enterococcus sp. BWT-B8]